MSMGFAGSSAEAAVANGCHLIRFMIGLSLLLTDDLLQCPPDTSVICQCITDPLAKEDFDKTRQTPSHQLDGFPAVRSIAHIAWPIVGLRRHTYRSEICRSPMPMRYPMGRRGM